MYRVVWIAYAKSELEEICLQLTEDANALRDSQKSPLDEFKQQISEIDKLFAAGKICPETRDQAKLKARDQLIELPKDPMQEYKKRV